MDTNRLDGAAARSTEELQRELAAKGVRFVFAQVTDIHGAVHPEGQRETTRYLDRF